MSFFECKYLHKYTIINKSLISLLCLVDGWLYRRVEVNKQMNLCYSQLKYSCVYAYQADK
jgi:hypothetical protein